VICRSVELETFEPQETDRWDNAYDRFVRLSPQSQES
jgi:hypothetical protein